MPYASRTTSGGQSHGGSSHTCAWLDNGQLKCWGSWSMALGSEIRKNIGDDPSEMGDAPTYVDLK